MQGDKREYGGDYLYAEDLLSGGKFHTATVEIAEVFHPGTLKAANGKMIDKWVIGFKGKDKKLCLATTNTRIIHIVSGNPPGDAWIGHKVTMQARTINAFGAETLAIRIIPPVGTPLRKTLNDRLGRPAEYHGQVIKQEKPEESETA